MAIKYIEHIGAAYNRCPKCGSDNIYFAGTDSDFDWYAERCECNDCKCNFSQIFVYSHQIEEQYDGEE